MANLALFNLGSFFNILSALYIWRGHSFQLSYLAQIASTLVVTPLLCAYLIEPSNSVRCLSCDSFNNIWKSHRYSIGFVWWEQHWKYASITRWRCQCLLQASIWPVSTCTRWGEQSNEFENVQLFPINFSTCSLQMVLYHSLVLTSLSLYPSENGSSLMNLLFVLKPNNNSNNERRSKVNPFLQLGKHDKFILVNFLVVCFSSWFASFFYGLDKTVNITHYPVWSVMIQTDHNLIFTLLFYPYQVAGCIGAMVGSMIVNLISVTKFVFETYNTFLVHAGD